MTTKRYATKTAEELFQGILNIAAMSPAKKQAQRPAIAKIMRNAVVRQISGNLSGPVTVPPKHSTKLDCTLYLPVEATDPILICTQSDLDLISAQMTLMVRLIPNEKMRKCDCGKVFVRVGRREFCSERCQKRIYMRKLRATDREKKEAALRASVRKKGRS